MIFFIVNIHFIIVIINIKHRVLKNKANPKQILQHNNINNNDILYHSNFRSFTSQNISFWYSQSIKVSAHRARCDPF
jgi:hypothetical protein